jgi:putative spermidine/putrescine transport system ATP-binding protein
MPEVRVEHLRKNFGRTSALGDISLAVADTELIALLGPSGCGKTTLLRCIAGLTRPDSGVVLIAGRDVSDEPARVRDVGMVFQSYSLFPNMTAAQNVGFPLEARGWQKAAAAERIDEMLTLVGLAAIADRYPHQMSGGQQQRISLARALAGRPKVLLLDEPLSALDALTRTSLRDEIRRIQLKVGMTAIYVTHDQSEALAIADRVGVMDHGRLVEVGEPADVYLRPARQFTANFLGGRTMLRLAVDSGGRVGWGEAFALSVPWPSGTPVVVAFTPEAVHLGGKVGVEGCISLVSFRGATTRLQIETDHGEIAADVASTEAGHFKAGRGVRISVPNDQIQVFRADADDGASSGGGPAGR